MNITENKTRIGNFTSSEIWKLMKVGRDRVSFGAPALDYINERKMERKLGRSLSTQQDAKATLWGKLCEKRIFELLGIEYKYSAQKTILHPTFPFWAGSPDAEKGTGKDKTVVDLKCPFTLKSFCYAADSKDINEFLENHPDAEKYFWQIVSNSILTNSKWGELIFYCSYMDELEAIRDKSVSIEYEKARNEYAWIWHSLDAELPYLLRAGGYQNIKIIRWEISEEDKKNLTEKVIKANNLLIDKAGHIN